MKHALRKKELCESVMSVMDKIIPGRFRLRGMFLSEMYGILFYLAKSAWDNREIDRDECLNRLDIAKKVLEESITVNFFHFGVLRGIGLCGASLESFYERFKIFKG